MPPTNPVAGFGVLSASGILVFDSGTGKASCGQSLNVESVKVAAQPALGGKTAFEVKIAQRLQGKSQVGSFVAIADWPCPYEPRMLIDTGPITNPPVVFYWWDPATAGPVDLATVAAATPPGKIVGIQWHATLAGVEEIQEP